MVIMLALQRKQEQWQQCVQPETKQLEKSSFIYGYSFRRPVHAHLALGFTSISPFASAFTRFSDFRIRMYRCTQGFCASRGRGKGEVIPSCPKLHLLFASWKASTRAARFPLLRAVSSCQALKRFHKMKKTKKLKTNTQQNAKKHTSANAAPATVLEETTIDATLEIAWKLYFCVAFAPMISRLLPAATACNQIQLTNSYARHIWPAHVLKDLRVLVFTMRNAPAYFLLFTTVLISSCSSNVQIPRVFGTSWQSSVHEQNTLGWHFRGFKILLLARTLARFDAETYHFHTQNLFSVVFAVQNACLCCHVRVNRASRHDNYDYERQ